MIKIILFIAVLSLVGCSTNKEEIVQGYEGAQLENALYKIQGRSHREVLKIMGNPAIHGLCKDYDGKKLYRLIYLTKDMTRFYADLFNNTDSELDCVVLNLKWDAKRKKFIFNRKDGLVKDKKCNQKDGAIVKFKEILDLQEAQEAQAEASRKSKK
jgi:outer membrane protein assembly factor BamE (lipoprotein component of BamABCDE complex)